MRIRALAVVIVALLPACGATAATVPRHAAVVPATTPSPSPSQPVPGPPPTPMPATAPAASSLPALIAPVSMPLSFGLIAVNSPGAHGAVTVLPATASYRLAVTVSGLAPGVHSVHLHFGSCPSAGVHILVLGVLRADASGNGSMTAVVNARYVGDGRFVIVYVGPSAGPLAACANLAGR